MPSETTPGRFEAHCAHEPNCWTVIDTRLPLPQGPPWLLCPLTTEATARQRAKELNGAGPGGIAGNGDDGSGVLPNGLTPADNAAMVADLEGRR